MNNDSTILSFVTEARKYEPEYETNRTELVKDIAAFASILVKFHMDHILMNQTLFIEVLNEAGFRTTKGNEFNKMNFRMMIERLQPSQKLAMIEEFKKGHRDFDIFYAMFDTK